MSWQEYCNQASQAVSQGNYGEAERIIYQAFKEARQAKDLERICISLDSLGWLAFMQQKFDEAEKIYQYVAKVKVQMYGADHIEIARTLKNLIAATYQTKAYDRVVPYAKEAARIFATSMGIDYAECQQIAFNLFELLKWLGRQQEAAEIQAYYLNRQPPAQAVPAAAQASQQAQSGAHQQTYQSAGQQVYQSANQPAQADGQYQTGGQQGYGSSSHQYKTGAQQYQSGAQQAYQSGAQQYQSGAQQAYQSGAQQHQSGAQQAYQSGAQQHQSGAQQAYQSGAQQHPSGAQQAYQSGAQQYPSGGQQAYQTMEQSAYQVGGKAHQTLSQQGQYQSGVNSQQTAAQVAAQQAATAQQHAQGVNAQTASNQQETAAQAQQGTPGDEAKKDYSKYAKSICEVCQYEYEGPECLRCTSGKIGVFDPRTRLDW